jgi:hypothetical protein
VTPTDARGATFDQQVFSATGDVSRVRP